MRDGPFEAAQALSAHLIDALGKNYVARDIPGFDWKLVATKVQQPQVLRRHPVRDFVLAPLAAGHREFHGGSAVPTTFTRHATAHGVSGRQYTRANCLVALMKATALLCRLEREASAFEG